MIESITITNYLGQSQEMILTQPELSGFIVKSIDGLGPTTANINFSELATIDGAIDNSARLDTRELKIDLIFLEHPTIEDTRQMTYALFPIKRNVIFTIKTTNNNLHCYGRVEKNEPKIFDKREGTSITIKCGDPYWHTDTRVHKMFFGTDPLFEFVYSNESDQTQQAIATWNDVIPFDRNEFKGYQSYSYHYQAEKVHVRFRTKDSQSYLMDRAVSSISTDPDYIDMVGKYADTSPVIYEDTNVKVVCWMESEIYADGRINIGVNFKHWPLTTDDKNYVIYTTPMVKGTPGNILVGNNTEFGNINTFTEGTINYDGEIETGLILEIQAKNTASGVRFYDMETGEMIRLDDNIIQAKTGQGIIQGDVITINTNIGKKSVSLLRNGVSYDILNALIPREIDGVKRIEWFKLYKGNNTFGYSATTGLEDLIFNVEYDELYEGV